MSDNGSGREYGQVYHYIGDVRVVLEAFPDQSVQCVVTSPPYWGLRKYAGAQDMVWGGEVGCAHEWGERVRTDRRGLQINTAVKTVAGTQRADARTETRGQYCQHCPAWRGALGLEPTPDLYVQHMVEVFREVRRVLRDDGVLWLNLGSSYATGAGKVGARPGGGAQGDAWAAGKGEMTAPNRMPIPGFKPKDLVPVPWLAGLALQADGWWLRCDGIWQKPNPMPSSVRDRPTISHEYVLLLTKSARYFYDADAIREPLAASTLEQVRQGYNGTAVKDFATAGAQDGSGVKGRIIAGLRKSGNKARKIAETEGDRGRLNTHMGSSIPWESDGLRGANARSVWTITPRPYAAAHFATFPPALAERCLLAGSRPGDWVLDPFAGSGTVGAVASLLGRHAAMIDLAGEYVDLQKARVAEAKARPERYLTPRPRPTAESPSAAPSRETPSGRAPAAVSVHQPRQPQAQRPRPDPAS